MWKLDGDDEEADEVRLYAVSEAKRMTEEALLARHRARYEEALRRLDEGLTTPHRRKRYEKVVETVGRLQERHRLVSAQYAVDVLPGAGPNATAVRWRRTKRHAARDAGAGSYLLRSSRTDWGTEQIVRTYWRLTEIEATFRSLKTELGLRPIWHVKRSRIAAHLFLAVLAYHRGTPDPHPAEDARHSPLVGRDPDPAALVGADHHHDPGDERSVDREPAGRPAPGAPGPDRPGGGRRAPPSPPPHPPEIGTRLTNVVPSCRRPLFEQAICQRLTDPNTSKVAKLGEAENA